MFASVFFAITIDVERESLNTEQKAGRRTLKNTNIRVELKSDMAFICARWPSTAKSGVCSRMK